MYAFYDFETSGAETAFDQPLQFAAVLTDEKFNELESINLRCRLAPHILPAPWAMQVTGISLEQLTNPELPSLFEFSIKLRDIINKWTPSIWVGYNSIAFDETIMRQMFYQNLQPNIYMTQMNGNSRLDILTAVYATFALSRESLNWPVNEDNINTFKLDKMAPANGFNEHNAHDALGDVRATIWLAKLIKETCPSIWEQYLRSINKNSILSVLKMKQPLSFIARNGKAPPREYITAFIGRSSEDRNKIVLIDLEVLLEKPADQLLEPDSSTFLDKFPNLLHYVRLNAAPFLSIKANPNKEVTQKWDSVSNNLKFFENVSKFLDTQRLEYAKSDLVELQIYENFVSDHDKNILEGLTFLDWLSRKHEIEKIHDKRLRILGSRILLWEAPELVKRQTRVVVFEAIQERWNNMGTDAGPWMTFDRVSKQLNQLVLQGYFSDQKKKNFENFYAGRIENLKFALGL